MKGFMMYKKIIFTVLATATIFGLSGCGGSSNHHHNDELVTLFLVDDNGYSYGGIPYKCDSMTQWETTLNNGEFTFLPPDNCLFNFDGLDGVYGDSFDDVVRIVDYSNDGKGGIPYECALFGASSTYGDGSFDYNVDDACVFYL